jgi:hypothetical protein
VDSRERFLVELEALPNSYPAAVRLRRFLKAALRTYRLRAVKVEPAAERPGGLAGDEPGDGAGDEAHRREHDDFGK